MRPTWGPPGSCWPQMGPMLAPWTLLSDVERGHWNGELVPVHPSVHLSVCPRFPNIIWKSKIIGCVVPILDLWWQKLLKYGHNWWFPTIIGKHDPSSHLKQGEYTYYVSIQPLFDFGTVGVILAFWKNDLNEWTNHPINFNLGAYTYWISIKKSL